MLADQAALHELTASDAARRIRAGEVSPVDLVQALLARAESVEPRVQAWELLDAEGALAAARVAEELASKRPEELGPLHGVPFGAKDIFDTVGLRTAGNFGPYDNRLPARDAEVVARLRRAGAILLGKTVTTQFANMDPPKTRNPWSAERTPGGSSSGSGAGVAAREMPFALGSQTIGSVLRPAAYNGVVGLKPTYGRVSKRGVMPAAWSLDHVGVLARSVEDCALFLTVVAGYDPEDPDSADVSVPSFAPMGPVAPPRLGLLRASFDYAKPSMRAHLEQVANQLQSAGATIEEIVLDEPFDLIHALHQVTLPVETAAARGLLLQRFPESFAPQIRSTVEIGQLIPGAAYARAQRLRRRVGASVEQTFRRVDAALFPTISDVAPGRETTGEGSLQALASLLGLPAITVPSGLSEEGLPLAIQLVAPRWQEPRLLDVARWCETVLPPMPEPFELRETLRGTSPAMLG